MDKGKTKVLDKPRTQKQALTKTSVLKAARTRINGRLRSYPRGRINYRRKAFDDKEIIVSDDSSDEAPEHHHPGPCEEINIGSTVGSPSINDSEQSESDDESYHVSPQHLEDFEVAANNKWKKSEIVQQHQRSGQCEDVNISPNVSSPSNNDGEHSATDDEYHHDSPQEQEDFDVAPINKRKNCRKRIKRDNVEGGNRRM